MSRAAVAIIPGLAHSGRAAPKEWRALLQLPARRSAASLLRHSVPCITARSVQPVTHAPSFSVRSYSAAATAQVVVDQGAQASTNANDSAFRAEMERRMGGPKAGDTIIVAMSGGVDSSLCASLLRRSPGKYDLRAVFMRNWNTLEESEEFEPGSGGANGCEWQKEWEDVQKVCRHLGNIPVELKDLSREYWNTVFEPALDCWAQGKTPNPDVSCNREIKFGALIKVLFEQGDPYLRHRATEGKAWLATGHYAGIRIERGINGTPIPQLIRCKDQNKDQTYYLSSVSQNALRLAHFPLTDYLKTEVKALAREHGLPTADRPESMGLCFVGERPQGARSSSTEAADGSSAERMGARDGFGRFISSYLPAAPGSTTTASSSGQMIELTTGRRIAAHKGMHTLTIGQNARIGGQKKKLFVCRKEISTNTVYVVQGKDHPALLCRYLEVPKSNFHWFVASRPRSLGPDGGLKALAQIRHRQRPVPCRVTVAPLDGAVRVAFEDDHLVQAAAPGQVVALWNPVDGTCIGSGVIEVVSTLFDETQNLATDMY